ncbi:MAG: hypothetical protein ACOYOP_09340 [Microthrixaceae bacterium]
MTDTDAATPAGERTIPFWSFIAFIVAAQLLDLVIATRVSLGPVSSEPALRSVIESGEDVSDVLFLVTLVVAVAAELLKVRTKWITAAVIAYLSLATVNLLENVVALVGTAEFRQVERLALLWDVGLVYASTVIIFALWYRLIDTEFRHPVFEFPEDPYRPDRRPGWMDYVFLSFNTNATFGPTAEVVHGRSGKVLMMIQTIMSLLLLVVLLARIAGLGA